MVLDNYFTSFHLLAHLGEDHIWATRVLNKNSLCKCTITGKNIRKKKERGHIEQRTSVILYLRLSGQFQVCLFFYEKILSVKKAPKRTTNNFYSLRSFCACQKIMSLFFFVHLFLFCWLFFWLWRVFVRLKLSCKKVIINRLEIVLITSNTILVRCTPIYHPTENYFSSNGTNYFLSHLPIF